MPHRKKQPALSASDAHALASLLRRVADTLEDAASPAPSQTASFRQFHALALATLTRLESQSVSVSTTGMCVDGIGLKIDREANAALQLWGRWPLDEFLTRWKSLDRVLIKRACPVLGLAAPATWRRPQQAELHRRAQRFARNTQM